MKGLGGIFLFVIFLVLISLRQLISLYVDWLWFQEVGYTQVFTTSLFFKTVLALLGGGIFALLIYANVRIAARSVRGIRFLDQENFLELPRPGANRSLSSTIAPACGISSRAFCRAAGSQPLGIIPTAC